MDITANDGSLLKGTAGSNPAVSATYSVLTYLEFLGSYPVLKTLWALIGNKLATIC
jgi:hypothetical protein